MILLMNESILYLLALNFIYLHGGPKLRHFGQMNYYTFFRWIKTGSDPCCIYLYRDFYIEIVINIYIKGYFPFPGATYYDILKNLTSSSLEYNSSCLVFLFVSIFLLILCFYCR